jgi:hypothetical protein
MRSLVALLLCIFWCVLANAAEQLPIVTVEVKPAQVLVGQPVQLRVTVLVPTWFANPSIYPSFELANTVTRLPPDSSFSTREQVAGEWWSGIARDYEIHPQLAAQYQVSGQTIRVNYAHPETRKSTAVDIAVPDIAFSALVPTGAEFLEPFLAGTKGTIEADINGDLDDLQSGDAIVLTVTASLRGTPVMFLPSLIPQTDQAGLRAYAKEPVLQDGDEAKRIETVTYILEGGGEFELPTLELKWWDTNTNSIERATTAPLTLYVKGAPFEANVPVPAATAPPWVSIIGAAAVLVLAVLTIGFLRKGWTRFSVWMVGKQTQRQASEPYAFRQLMQSVTQCNDHDVDRWLSIWLNRLGTQPSLKNLDACSGSNVELEVMAWHRSRYSTDLTAVGFAKLASALPQARKRYLTAQKVQTGTASLPPLNPAS